MRENPGLGFQNQDLGGLGREGLGQDRWHCAHPAGAECIHSAGTECSQMRPHTTARPQLRDQAARLLQ